MKAVAAVNDAVTHGVHRHAADLREHGSEGVRHAGHALDFPFGEHTVGIGGDRLRRGLEQIEFE